MQHTYRTLTLGFLLVALTAGPSVAVVPEVTIYDLQQNLFTLGDSCLVDSVVVIGVDIRPGTYGVYIQEPQGGPFSGILAYRAGNFPAYNNSADPVQVGDLINVRGTFADFAGLAELDVPSLNKLGTVTPLTPVTLPIDSLTTSYPGSERWEGVLVRVENVQVQSVDGFRTWRFHHFTGPNQTDSLAAYEKMISGQVVPQVGDQLLSVTGVHDYAFNERRIAPRNDNDIVFLSPAPPPVPNLAYSTTTTNIKIRFNVQLNPTDAQTTSHYSLSSFQTVTGAVYNDPTKTVTLTIGTPLVPSTTPLVVSMDGIRNSQNVLMSGTETVSLIGGISSIPFVQTPVSAANDTSQVVNQQVSIRGVVTAVGDGLEFPAGIGFYLQDRSATEYAGIFVFGSPTTPSRGDSVLVSGTVTEFGVGPETEITSVDEVIVYSAVTDVAPVDVTLAQISGSNLAEAEKYESTLVRVQNVGVITMGFAGAPFDIAVAGDTMRVDDLAIEESAYQPYYEDVLDVAGVIRFSGSAPNRRLQPRNWNEPPVGDIHVVSKSTVSDAPPAAYRTLLAQNEPNPFNPSTRIAFTIGTPGRVSLRVYDLAGKLVATLLEREVKTGPGVIEWNGLDDKGRRVPSGVYVYRLQSADGEQARKMVLLK